MIPVKNIAKRHPIASFFILTFAVSWSMFGLALTMFPDSELGRVPLVSAGAFAPALVSIYLTAVINPGRNEDKGRRRLAAFLSSWVVAWINLILFASLVNGLHLTGLLMATTAVTALLPALVFSSALSRREGVKEHLSSLVRPRGHPGWYILALILVPILLFLGRTVASPAGEDISEPQYPIQGEVLPMIIVMTSLVFLANLINSGGLAEEPGWRGFALRRLQRKRSPLAAGLFIGFMWALWHIPMMFSQLRTSGPVLVLFQVVQIGIAFTWFFNRTRGSILAAALLHASWNTGVGFIPRTNAFHLLMAVVLVTMVGLDRMWKKREGGPHEI